MGTDPTVFAAAADRGDVIAFASAADASTRQDVSLPTGAHEHAATIKRNEVIRRCFPKRCVIDQGASPAACRTSAGGRGAAASALIGRSARQRRRALPPAQHGCGGGRGGGAPPTEKTDAFADSGSDRAGLKGLRAPPTRPAAKKRTRRRTGCRLAGSVAHGRHAGLHHASRQARLRCRRTHEGGADVNS